MFLNLYKSNTLAPLTATFECSIQSRFLDDLWRFGSSPQINSVDFRTIATRPGDFQMECYQQFTSFSSVRMAEQLSAAWNRLVTVSRQNAHVMLGECEFYLVQQQLQGKLVHNCLQQKQEAVEFELDEKTAFSLQQTVYFLTYVMDKAAPRGKCQECLKCVEDGLLIEYFPLMFAEQKHFLTESAQQLSCFDEEEYNLFKLNNPQLCSDVDGILLELAVKQETKDMLSYV